MAITEQAPAVVFEQPGNVTLRHVGLPPATAEDCIVDVEWSGISTGTERLLWQGRMPPFPGLSYPLVPGYEAVGRISAAAADSALETGQRVFVPGSRGYADVAGLFGGASSRIVVPADRVIAVGDELGEEATLLALAATAHHAVQRARALPDLVVGHGVLGRLIARLLVALGRDDVVVWETQAARRSGAEGYRVIAPDEDSRRDYPSIVDVSGAEGLLDTLVGHLAPGGEIILAGFYDQPLSFAFPPAFMREASIAIAAEWQPADLVATLELVTRGELSLAGLITHRERPDAAEAAYATAFESADCLKMILDWRTA